MKIWHQSLTTIDTGSPYRDAIMNHVKPDCPSGRGGCFTWHVGRNLSTITPEFLLPIPTCKIFIGSNLSGLLLWLKRQDMMRCLSQLFLMLDFWKHGHLLISL